jgi:hypothetical protein
MESKHHHRPRKSFEIITLSHEIMNEFSLLVGTVETRPRVQQTLSLRSRFRVLYCQRLVRAARRVWANSLACAVSHGA